MPFCLFHSFSLSLFVAVGCVHNVLSSRKTDLESIFRVMTVINI
uniref:Uncharacterized protein n=1 Tax=Pygocentrus nattereri TaxID=42514 RepID=A0AAR2M2Z2_PYGNA